MKKTFRCTRRRPYPPGTPGHTDLSAREGYYIRAYGEAEALATMKVIWYGEGMYGFDIQPWS